MKTNNFDGLRLVAALSVPVSHQYVNLGRPEPMPFGELTLGGLAVLLFFSISGYLVASSWNADPKVWRFAIRRLLRILPAYVVVVIGAALYIGLTDSRPLATTAAWMYVYKHLTFHAFEWDFFTGLIDARLNPPLWTITFEIYFYAALAALATVAGKYWGAACAALVAIACAVWGIGVPMFNPSNAAPVDNAVLFGTFFAFGAALFALPVLRTGSVTAAIVAAGALAYFSGSQAIGLALAIPALTIHIGTRSWPLLRDAARFGDLSYGIYLWSWPVQQVVFTRLPEGSSFGVLLGTSLVATLAVSMLSWHLIERPALKAKPAATAPWPRWLTLEKG